MQYVLFSKGEAKFEKCMQVQKVFALRQLNVLNCIPPVTQQIP